MFFGGIAIRIGTDRANRISGRNANGGPAPSFNHSQGKSSIAGELLLIFRRQGWSGVAVSSERFGSGGIERHISQPSSIITSRGARERVQ
jgi:hypothetical protein